MYSLLLVFLVPLSCLPLRVLYLLSDFGFFILYKVVKYRRAIVAANLKAAYPEFSPAELIATEVQFYHFFCDQWIETIKMLTLSPEKMMKRMTGNWEVMDKMYAEGKNCYLLMGHFFNWEWTCLATQQRCHQQFAGIYTPVTSTSFDRLMYRIRVRAGGIMIAKQDFRKGISKLQNTSYAVGLIADQNPATETPNWYNFMNRPAPFLRGPETMARKAKAAVVFCACRRVRRGHYELVFTPFQVDASQSKPGDITAAYVRFLEMELKNQPSNWLWSHRRWKHAPPAELEIINL